MAKRSSTNHISKYFPAKITLTIVALAVLLTTTLFVSAYNQPQTTTSTQSHAAGPRPTPTPFPALSACARVFHGTCYNIYSHYCSRGYRSGYCPGPSNIRCCP
jgi:hypothetical protein